MVLTEWALSKLETVTNCRYVLVRDPLRLLPESGGAIHSFGREHGFTVLVAATNLVFRELYESATADPETKKLLVLDRTPARRREYRARTQAPPLFYPDLLAITPPEARIDLGLRQFLVETTGDPLWPQTADDHRYARLVARHLDGVLRAHRNLRVAHAGRFTDHDFATVVAFAAMGVAEGAFKKLGAEDYWRIGLAGHEALAELDSLAPEVTKPIKEELRKAPAPFCWLGDHDPEPVIRAFYLAAILSQHTRTWSLLLANVDPALASFSGIKDEVLREAAPKLVALDPAQASRDLETVEESLDLPALQLLLLDQMKLGDATRAAEAIEQERYSTLIRSLALLIALDDLLSARPAPEAHARVHAVLFPDGAGSGASVVDVRPSASWSDLKEAYRLAREIRSLASELGGALKTLGVLKTEQLTFKLFRDLWNDRRINRLEYFVSALERLAETGNLLPRPPEGLPAAFIAACERVRQRVRSIVGELSAQLDDFNRRFQEMVAAQYPKWVADGGDVVLTSQFISRCLKPHWDPQQEKAVLFIFDGMRYDIWDELLKPMLLDRMEIVADLPASSLLPSETHVTRKAISAGAWPDEFDQRSGEDRLLENALARLMGYHQKVQSAIPEGAGTGETVRYRAGNLDVYIFELCDKELHKIKMKDLGNGRMVPSRPIAFIYQQQLKNIVDTEVMAIVRGLPAGTKVFVTADHGFGRVGREPLWFAESDLNNPLDCAYLSCRLRVPIEQADIPPKVRTNIIAFTPPQVRMPAEETWTPKSGPPEHKKYGAIVFPKVGYSFSRRGSPYNPDAYSHGGISVQELLIPMVALRVRPREEGLLALEAIEGPGEVIEGEDVEFRMRLRRSGGGGVAPDELRVETDATYSREPDRASLPHQVLYVPAEGRDVVYRFRPDPADATDDERREGVMERALTIAASYREGHRAVRKSQTHRFSVRLNSEQVVRRVGNLGAILGLTPKSMRS